MIKTASIGKRALLFIYGATSAPEKSLTVCDSYDVKHKQAHTQGTSNSVIQTRYF